jgi:FixJ family two-component response regulator
MADEFFQSAAGMIRRDRRPTSPRDLASTEPPIVFVIDDDASVREALRRLLRSVGLRVKVVNSASAFLQSKLPDVASCLILDIRRPSGLDFQEIWQRQAFTFQSSSSPVMAIFQCRSGR